MDKIVRKAALVACSDPLSEARLPNVEDLIDFLESRGLSVELSPYLFGCREDDPGRKKAEFMNRCFKDPEMEFVFDISGGDLANTVLRHLDYEMIKGSRAEFYGFSDLTTVINAIYARTGREAVNYQVRNVVWNIDGGSSEEDRGREYFDRSVLGHAVATEDLEAHFLRGGSMCGPVIGGNARCMLKLAGTPFWPQMQGAILLLEARGGGVSQVTTMLEQYLELGAAEQISGVLLGTFTQMEREGLQPQIGEIALRMFPENVPVARTRFVGHGRDARAIVIGRELRLEAGTTEKKEGIES